MNFGLQEVPLDNCPDDFNPHQENSDEDGVDDGYDNCLGLKNPDQDNIDGDSHGDACDKNTILDFNDTNNKKICLEVYQQYSEMKKDTALIFSC